MTGAEILNALNAADIYFVTKVKTGVDWNSGAPYLNLEIRYHETTFDDLERLAEFFGTRKINVGTGTEETGFCETCRSTETFTVLIILEPTKNA